MEIYFAMRKLEWLEWQLFVFKCKTTLNDCHDNDFILFIYFSNDYNFQSSISAAIGDYDVDEMVTDNGIGCNAMDDLLASYEPPTDLHLQNL